MHELFDVAMSFIMFPSVVAKNLVSSTKKGCVVQLDMLIFFSDIRTKAAM